MNSVRRLIAEIHRRSLWQVLGVYVVGGYIAYEVVVNLTEGLGLPAWVPPLALILFIIGLPVVLATAFVQEGVPGLGGAAGPGSADRVEGLERLENTASSAGSPDASRPTTRDPQPATAGSGATLLTWPRAITAGVLAFAVLGLGTTGFMGMRALGIGPAGTLMARGVLDARERIVLGDFEGTGGGDEYASAVRTALRADLESSPVVELLGDDAVERALRRMERDPTTPLAPAVARELAIRAGLKATIEGEVARLGTSWVVSARIVAAQTGEALASFRESAADESGLIGAVDRLSRSIREKVGEKLSTARAGEPLEQVTTSSLEALRLYGEAEALAYRQSDYYGAVLRLEQALALDSTFAMAWRKLAVRLGNASSQPARQREASNRAYALRDRLSERERLITEGHHYAYAGDFERSKAALRTLLERYPGDQTGRINLASRLINQQQFDEALALIQGGFEHGLDHPFLYTFRTEALWRSGRRDEARATIREGVARHPFVPSVRRLELQEAMNLGDYARADSLIVAFERDLPDEGFVTTWKFLYRGWIDGAQGRFAAVDTLIPVGNGGLPENLHREALLTIAEWHGRYALQTGDTARARRAIDEALAAMPLEGIPEPDRPFGPVAYAYAAAGATAAADSLLNAWVRRTGRERDPGNVVHNMMRMWSDPEGAADAVRFGTGIRGLGSGAEIMMRAGRGDSAATLYTRYLEDDDFWRVRDDAIFLPLALERLAEFHDARGERDKAIEYYGRFVELWKDADPIVRPRVDAARRRLEALATDR